MRTVRGTGLLTVPVGGGRGGARGRSGGGRRDGCEGRRVSSLARPCCGVGWPWCDLVGQSVGAISSVSASGVIPGEVRPLALSRGQLGVRRALASPEEGVAIGAGLGVYVAHRVRCSRLSSWARLQGAPGRQTAFVVRGNVGGHRERMLECAIPWMVVGCDAIHERGMVGDRAVADRLQRTVRC